VAIGVLAHAMRRAEHQGRSVALVAGERSVAARILKIAGLPVQR
jgi:anti-anti-sigma regulatory factor